MSPSRPFVKQFFVFVLGFASGLPLALCGSTLQAWFAVSGVDVIVISSLALVGQPYLYKFIWAPLLDRFMPLPLERRRGWILLTQVSIVVLLILMSYFEPQSNAGLLAALAFALAFASATQDVAVDAYRADLLESTERGIGAAMAVTGYRVGMLLSGGVALIMAERIGWHLTYLLMAAAMLLGCIASLFAPRLPHTVRSPQTLKAAFTEPLKEFFSRKNAWLILLLIIMFKLGDAFTSTSGSMSTTFLLQGLGFSLTTVGQINKMIGLAAVLSGVFVGGWLLIRVAVYDALIWFGLLQAISNLGYVLLAIVGKNVSMLITVVIIENFAAGLGNAVIIAFLMSLCDARYSATQYAFLSAIAVAPRILLGPLAGVAVFHFGWVTFFVWTFLLGLPGVLLAYWFKHSGHFGLITRPTVAPIQE